MPIRASCPECHAEYDLADHLAGKRVLCAQCRCAFAVPVPAELAEAVQETPAAGGAIPVPAQDEEPRRRRGSSRASDDEDRPRRRSLESLTRPKPATNPVQTVIGCVVASAIFLMCGGCGLSVLLSRGHKQPGPVAVFPGAPQDVPWANPVDAPAAEKNFEIGNALFQQHRFQDAEAAYRLALGFRPDFPEARVALGKALARQDRYQEAEAAYREVIRLHPDSADAYLNLALALNELHRPADAAAAARDAIRLRPKDAEAHLALGNALNAQSRFKEAVAALDAAVALRPDDPEAHYSLGTALFNAGRYGDGKAAWKAAEKGFRQALQREPDSPLLNCRLGQALQEQGRLTEALAAMRRGNDLGAQDPEWRRPSAEWLRELEDLVKLDRRLPAVLRGDERPADAAEGLRFSWLCQRYRDRPRAAVRLAAAAFAADRNVADTMDMQYRYNAACAAAVAASGEGEDARQLPDKVVAMLRRQALVWLREDLALYRREVRVNRDNAVRWLVGVRMHHWLQDGDFNSVRGEALARMAEPDRRAWQELWAEVDALRNQVGGPR